MAKLQVTTKSAEEVWSSPDKKITIFKVALEYEGKTFVCKTYSKAIATEGWSGEVESYEKEGRNGSETFVKQPQKEGGWSGGGGRASVKSDPHTMYMSYAKDLAIACIQAGKTPTTVAFDSEVFAELLEAVEAGGAQLYATRPDAPKTDADSVKEVFSGAKEVTVTDEELDNADNGGLPL